MVLIFTGGGAEFFIGSAFYWFATMFARHFIHRQLIKVAGVAFCDTGMVCILFFLKATRESERLLWGELA